MKTWFECTSSVKKRKQRETIVWLLLILFFAWLVVATLKAYLNSLEKESVAILQTSQLSFMRGYAYSSHAYKNDHVSNYYNSRHANENGTIADDKAPLYGAGLSLIEKQKVLRATRMHNTLRTVRKNNE